MTTIDEPCLTEGHAFAPPPDGCLTLVDKCTRCGQFASNAPLLDSIRSAFDRAKEVQGADITTLKGDGWHGTMTCPACPVQIEGEVDGLPFYFRSRWESWRFSIASVEGDPVHFGDRYESGGDAPESEMKMNGSWMAHADAWAIVAREIQAFRGRRGSE